MDKFDSDCGRVMLRNVIEDDLAVFYEHQMDPDAFRMAAYPPKERDAFLRIGIKIWRTIRTL